MSNRFNIALKTNEDKKDFVELANEFDSDLTLYSGKHSADAKSILGVHSIDTMNCYVVIGTNDPDVVDIAKIAFEKYITD